MIHTPVEVVPLNKDYEYGAGSPIRRWWNLNQGYMSDPAFAHMRLKGINYVPGRGDLEPAGLMFIGEAPGTNENIQQIPFVGKAGEIWEQMLKHIGLEREDVYITNVVKYQPMKPTNRDPTPYEITNSLRYLTEEVNLVNPKIIVPMGRFATRAFYPNKDANATRGKVLERRGRYVAPIYHPAAAGYNAVLLPKLQKQFEQIGRLLE